VQDERKDQKLYTKPHANAPASGRDFGYSAIHRLNSRDLAGSLKPAQGIVAAATPVL